MKSGIKRMASLFGFRINRISATDDPYASQRIIVGLDNPLILDIGAYIGETISRYRSAFEDPTIIGFEPFPDSYAKVCERFRCVPGVEILNRAVCEKDSERSFFCNQGAYTNSLLPVSNDGRNLWGKALQSKQVIQAECVSLDQFCQARNISHVDIVKLDIQGAELLALRGARRLLRARAISLVYSEFILHSTYSGQVPMHTFLRFMSRYGYQLHNIFEPIRISGRLVQCDLLFVSPSLAKTIDAI